MKKIIIFDLDGTLVNTITDVGVSCNYALKQLNFPQHELRYYNDFVGGNLEQFISKTLPVQDRNEKNISQVKNLYREYYMNHNMDYSKPFDGIESVVQELLNCNCKIYINTNKGQDLSENLVSKMFPNFTFSGIVGYQDKLPNKPDPTGVYNILSMEKAKKSECIYIGDTSTDLKTAENAGIECIYCTWGQGKNDDLEKFSPKFICNSPLEIIKAVKG